MQLSVKAFALTAAIMGAAVWFISVMFAMFIPSWGEPFMELTTVIGPGVTGANWPSAALLVPYGVIDGLVFGGLFAWLYNQIVRRSVPVSPNHREPSVP